MAGLAGEKCYERGLAPGYKFSCLDKKKQSPERDSELSGPCSAMEFFLKEDDKIDPTWSSTCQTGENQRDHTWNRKADKFSLPNELEDRPVLPDYLDITSARLEFLWIANEDPKGTKSIHGYPNVEIPLRFVVALEHFAPILNTSQRARILIEEQKPGVWRKKVRREDRAKSIRVGQLETQVPTASSRYLSSFFKWSSLSVPYSWMSLCVHRGELVAAASGSYQKPSLPSFHSPWMHVWQKETLVSFQFFTNQHLIHMKTPASFFGSAKYARGIETLGRSPYNLQCRAYLAGAYLV